MYTNPTSRAEAQGNGVATDFPVSLQVYDVSHLQVWRFITATQELALLVRGTDYNLTLNSDFLGCQVQFIHDLGGGPVVFPPPSGHKFVFLRVVPYTQEQDLRTYGATDKEGLERQLDLIVMAISQLSEIVDRCAKMDVTYGAGSGAEYFAEIQAQVALALAAREAADAAAAAAAASETAAAESASALPNISVLEDGEALVRDDISWGGVAVLKQGDNPSNLKTRFGAKGDGLADDTAKFADALNSGERIFIPDGMFMLEGQFSITGKHLRMHGVGRRESMLCWTTPTAGIVATMNTGLTTADYDYKSVNLQSFGFMTDLGVLATTSPLTIQADNNFCNVGRNRKGLLLRDLEVGGIDFRQSGWVEDIAILDFNSPEFRDLEITGWQDDSKSKYDYWRYFTMQHGVRVESTGRYELNSVIMDRCRFKNVAAPLRVLGAGEGVEFTNNLLPLCYTGPVIDRERTYPGAVQQTDPHVKAVGNHVNSVLWGFLLTRSHEWWVSNNILYSFPHVEALPTEAEAAWTGIYVELGSHGFISQNIMEGFPHVYTDTTPADGIDDDPGSGRTDLLRGVVLESCSGVRVIDNTYVRLDQREVMRGTCTYCEVSGTRMAEYDGTGEITVPSGATEHGGVVFEDLSTPWSNYVGPLNVASTVVITLTGTRTEYLTTPYMRVEAHRKYRVSVRGDLTCGSEAHVAQMDVAFTGAGGATFTADTPISSTQGLSGGVASQDFSWRTTFKANTGGSVSIGLWAKMAYGLSITIASGKLVMTIEKIV